MFPRSDCCCRRRYDNRPLLGNSYVNSDAYTPSYAATNPDGPSFGGGAWGKDPTTSNDRLKYVRGDPNEVCQGFSSVFPSGRWNGYYVEWAKRHDMGMELRFADGEVSGSGRDAIGDFLFFGVYRDSTRRVAWVKQYVGKHCVEYRGQGRGAAIDGDWAMLDNPQGTFTASDAFHLECANPLPPPPPLVPPPPAPGFAGYAPPPPGYGPPPPAYPPPAPGMMPPPTPPPYQG